MTSSGEFAAKRQAVLERFRSNKGLQRKIVEESGSFGKHAALYIEAFVRRKEPAEAGDRIPIQELEGILDEAKKQHRERSRERPPQDRVVGAGSEMSGGLMGLVQQGRELNFSETFFRWLGGTPLDLGISSTSVEDLEKLLVEVRFRRKALQAMLKLTEHELDEVKLEIQSKKCLADGHD